MPERKPNRKKATKATKALQIVPRVKKPREVRISAARKLFLEAYEKTFGNISASAALAGVNRVTVYRWFDSKSRVNRKFQKQVAAINPVERQKDFIEAKFMELVKDGVPAVVIHGAKTMLRERGFGDKLEIINELDERTKLLKSQIERRAADKQISFKEELENYLNLFGSDIKPEIKTELVSELEQ